MTEKMLNAQRVPTGFLTCQFDQIEEPGVYVTHRGDMFRIPPEALAEAHSPLVAWESRAGNLVTRITSDPYTPISKCRHLAADADLAVNF